MKAVLFGFLVLVLSTSFVKASEKEITSEEHKTLHLKLTLSVYSNAVLGGNFLGEKEEMPLGLKALYPKERPPLPQPSTTTETKIKISSPLQQTQEDGKPPSNAVVEKKQKEPAD